MRALYRFQLYCNLLGVSYGSWQHSRGDFYEDRAIFQKFLSIYEVETACICTFAKE